MRFLARLLNKVKFLPGRPSSFEGVNWETRWEKPISSFKELLLQSYGFAWIPFMMAFLHHLQYVNDVHMVKMVQYDVKLYPKKPVPRRLHL